MNKLLLTAASMLVASAWGAVSVSASEPITERPAGHVSVYNQDAVGYELYGGVYDTPPSTRSSPR